MTWRTIARFYKTVSTSPQNGGVAVLLDGKAVKTPGRNALLLQTAKLARAIADEWRAQGEHIDPASMPLTGLAYAALDITPNHRGKVIDHILNFGRSDLLCYRAERAGSAGGRSTIGGAVPSRRQDARAPRDLADRQARAWDPLLAWIGEKHGVRLQIGEGVAFIEQPVDALLALEKLVAALDDFQLAGLDRTTSLTGSLVLGLAILDGRLAAPEAFPAALVDETFQAETWGRDAAAEARRAQMLKELEAAERFVKLATTAPA
jgi:chaperone required for assembly of F1-ATPase